MSDTIEAPPEASGRFLIRIEPELHAVLRDEASEATISLNELCRRRLAGPGTAHFDPAVGAAIRARSVLGDSLLGIVGYGSWARNEMAEGSDLDLLMVLSSDVPITRTLYTRWDRDPLDWDGIAVEPHFVHLPEELDEISGTWAEVALEGIVLFERGFVVSRRLIEIRKRIADGEIRRSTLHGQPYWIRDGGNAQR